MRSTFSNIADKMLPETATHLRRIEVATPNGPVAYPAPASIVIGEERDYGAVPAVGDSTGEIPRGKTS